LCICVLIAYQVTQAAISNPGHGTSELEGNASLNMNSNKIINLTTPTADTDAATKAYVDASGGTVAFRYINYGVAQACPIISGVTCQVSVRFEPNYNIVKPCTNADAASYGRVCYYSSI